ncbi:MAG: hypothetical protein IKE73_00140 [Bacilli bacterium]|nr:hypothetical protein [Bacilli bacterium]
MKKKNLFIDIAIYTVMICTYIIPSGFIKTSFDFSKLIFSGIFLLLILFSKKIKVFDVIFLVILGGLTYYTKNLSFLTFIPLLYLGEIIKNKDYVENKLLNGNILYICLIATLVYSFISIFMFPIADKGIVREAYSAIVEKNQSAFAIFILGVLLLKKNKSVGAWTLIFGMFTFSRLYFLSVFMLLLSKLKIVKKIMNKINVKRWNYLVLNIIFFIILAGLGFIYLYLFNKGFIRGNTQLNGSFSLLDYSNLNRFTVNIIFVYMLAVSPKKYLFFGIKNDTYMGNIAYYARHAFNTHNPGIVPHNLFLSHLKVYGIFSFVELLYTAKYLKEVINKNNYILFLIVFITSSILGCGLYSYWLYMSVFAFIIYMKEKTN